MSRLFYNLFWLICLFLVTCIDVFSQNSICVEPSERAQKQYSKAVELWNVDQYKAKKHFYNALEIEPQWSAPYFFMAKSYFSQSEIIQYDSRKVTSLERLLNQASDLFEKVVEICPSYQNYESYYYLGKIYYTGGNLAEANNYLGKYINKLTRGSYLPLTQIMYNRTKVYKSLVDNPVKFNPKPVYGVCSSEDEFMPLLTPDGSRMYFTHKLWKKSEGSYSAKLVEEFCASDFITADSIGYQVFDTPFVLKYPFNQGANQGAATITIDNKRMFITVCEQTEMPDGRAYKNCDIYESRLLYGSWSAFERLGNGINGLTTWEGHPTINSDGTCLYFASYRPDGVGGIDIYKSLKDSVGNWGEPQNLGELVNSELNERAPFIHPDGKTLYFSSDGHSGVGGYDIFVSRLVDSVWQAPQNIGYPINTPNDESGFIVSTDGKSAYYSSEAIKGLGGYDIFSFELPKEVRPIGMGFIKGTLVDGRGLALDHALVEVRSISNNKIQRGIVDDITGRYAVALPTKIDNYILTVKKPNHIFTTKQIFLNDSTLKDLNLEFNFIVPKAQVGVTGQIPGILFDNNSIEFSKKSLCILDEFVAYLHENPTLKICIEGHTDSIATISYNQDLSEKRAKCVYDFLIKQGINQYRLNYKGFGSSKPISDNNTEQGRCKNRRTEFVIIDK